MDLVTFKDKLLAITCEQRLWNILAWGYFVSLEKCSKFFFTLCSNDMSFFNYVRNKN